MKSCAFGIHFGKLRIFSKVDIVDFSHIVTGALERNSLTTIWYILNGRKYSELYLPVNRINSIGAIIVKSIYDGGNEEGLFSFVQEAVW